MEAIIPTSPLFFNDSREISSMPMLLLRRTRECMQEALQLHYKRCYLYHLWEKQLAIAVENATVAHQENLMNILRENSLIDNGWLADLQELVLTPLQNVNLRLRQLQELVREGVQNAKEGKEKTSNGESSEFLNCSLLREVKKAEFFVQWVEVVQKIEREHFELLTKLGALFTKHISESFLRGDQCEACLCRVKYEWKMYKNEVLNAVEAQKEAAAAKDMKEKALLHDCASPSIPSTGLERHENSTNVDHSDHVEDCHPLLEKESASFGSQEPVKNHSSSSFSSSTLTGRTEETKIGSRPLLPHERQCPHLSVHDLHSCTAYRLLQRWRAPLHARCESSPALTSEYSCHSVGYAVQQLHEQQLLKVEREESERQKEVLTNNPWAQRLRFVECSENGYRFHNHMIEASSNEKIDDNVILDDDSEANCKVEGKEPRLSFKTLERTNPNDFYLSSPSFMRNMKDLKWDEMKLDEMRDNFPIISLSLCGEEQPLYPIGEEQEGEADDRASACEENRKKKRKEWSGELERLRHRHTQEKRDNAFDSRCSEQMAHKKGRGKMLDTRKSTCDAEESGSEKEEGNSSPYPRAMATYCPATVRHRCTDASKIIEPLLSSIQSTISCVMEFVEDLQCHLYDEDDDE